MNSKRKSLRLILWGFIFLAYFTPFKISSISIFMLFTFKFYKDVIVGIAFVSLIEFIFLFQSPIIIKNILSGITNYVINSQMTNAVITISHLTFPFSPYFSIFYISTVIVIYYIAIILACITFRLTLGRKILKRVELMI